MIFRQAKYAKINGNTICLYSEMPIYTNVLEIYLSDVNVVIGDDKVLTLTGDQWIWEFALDRAFIEDLPAAYQPIDKHLKFGYKSILDFIKGIQKPYVTGYYRLQRTESLTYALNNWTLIGYPNYLNNNLL